MNKLKIKTHAVFIDGENFSIRIAEIEKYVADDFILPQTKNIFSKEMFWHENYSNYFNKIKDSNLFRIYYYGSMKIGGYGNEIEIQRQELQNLGIGETFAVQRKDKKQTKTIDTKLTTDLLSLAASGRVDEIYMIGMDSDYLPVIEKAKSYGVKMTLAFPGFDLIRINAYKNLDEIKNRMGISKHGNYMLSFDRVDKEIQWFNIKSMTIDEIKEFSSIIFELLSKLFPDKKWNKTIENNFLKFTQEQNEKIRFVFQHTRVLQLQVEYATGGYSYYDLAIYPKSTFKSRLTKFINDNRQLIT